MACDAELLRTKGHSIYTDTRIIKKLDVASKLKLNIYKSYY